MRTHPIFTFKQIKIFTLKLLWTFVLTYLWRFLNLKLRTQCSRTPFPGKQNLRLTRFSITQEQCLLCIKMFAFAIGPRLPNLVCFHSDRILGRTGRFVFCSEIKTPRWLAKAWTRSPACSLVPTTWWPALQGPSEPLNRQNQSGKSGENFQTISSFFSTACKFEWFVSHFGHCKPCFIISLSPEAHPDPSNRLPATLPPSTPAVKCESSCAGDRHPQKEQICILNISLLRRSRQYVLWTQMRPRSLLISGLITFVHLWELYLRTKSTWTLLGHRTQHRKQGDLQPSGTRQTTQSQSRRRHNRPRSKL